MADESVGGYSGPDRRGKQSGHEIPNTRSTVEVSSYQEGSGNFSEDIIAEVRIDGERRGTIRCKSTEEYEWIKENLSGTRKRSKEERRKLG